MSHDTYQNQVYPELIHAAGDAGYILHATGGVGLSVMILAASIAFIRSGVVPKWAGWLGVVVAAAALATVAFITAFVWLLWIIIVALVLFWKGATPTTDPAPASSYGAMEGPPWRAFLLRGLELPAPGRASDPAAATDYSEPTRGRTRAMACSSRSMSS